MIVVVETFEHLRTQIGAELSSRILVDEQLELTSALLREARQFRDLTTGAGRADIRRVIEGTP